MVLAAMEYISYMNMLLIHYFNTVLHVSNKAKKQKMDCILAAMGRPGCEMHGQTMPYQVSVITNYYMNIKILLCLDRDLLP